MEEKRCWFKFMESPGIPGRANNCLYPNFVHSWYVVVKSDWHSANHTLIPNRQSRVLNLQFCFLGIFESLTTICIERL